MSDMRCILYRLTLILHIARCYLSYDYCCHHIVHPSIQNHLREIRKNDKEQCILFDQRRRKKKTLNCYYSKDIRKQLLTKYRRKEQCAIHEIVFAGVSEY